MSTEKNENIKENTEEIVEDIKVEGTEEVAEEVVTADELLVEDAPSNEELEALNETKELLVGNDKITAVDVLKAQLIDVIVVAGVSAIGTVLIDFILRLFQFVISDKFLFGVILFIPVLIIYNVIMTLKKDNMTLGQKVAKLKLTKNNK
ncbi:RDD family protein [Clostridium ihumii]|uniref:RDD family protein n=1 Tax=Clostridium ihumii TaxID=1470356 RepID=UPI0006844111|nr:RDD family protein [Clostridium ihumii]